MEVDEGVAVCEDEGVAVADADDVGVSADVALVVDAADDEGEGEELRMVAMLRPR